MNSALLLTVLRLVIPAGTAEVPGVIAPATPCTAPVRFWWNGDAFHVGEKAYPWATLGVELVDGAKFKIDLGEIGHQKVVLEATLDSFAPRFQVGAFGPIGNRRVENRVKVFPVADGTMRSYLKLSPQTPDYVDQNRTFKVVKGIPSEWEISCPGPSSGLATYRIFDTRGRLIYQVSGEFHAPELLFDYQYVWTDRAKKTLHLLTKNWTASAEGCYSIRVSAMDYTSETLCAWKKTVPARRAYGMEDYEISIDDLPAGFYWMHVDYLDGSDKIIHADKFSYLRAADKMPWDGTTLGTEDVVPPPWPQPEFGENSFTCWNREVKFGGRGLVSSVLNGGREQLAKPVALILDGRELEFDVILVERRNSSAAYRLQARDADVSVTAVCDFDGYVRFAIEYGGGVKSLDWRISVRREHVMAFTTGTWMEQEDAVVKPGSFERVLNASVNPWYWAGDATAGMMFGFANFRGTRVKELAKSTLVKGGDETFEVTLRIVDVPYDSAERRTAALYLEPTPVRPRNLDLADIPMDRIVTWTGHICDYFEAKYPGFEKPVLFKRYSDMLKEGKRVFYYNASSATSPVWPLWGWYGKDWARNADPAYYPHEAPKYDRSVFKKHGWTYACMNEKSYFESKLWGVNWYLNEAEPKMKDLYFDVAEPGCARCSSERHPCGWTDDFGRKLKGMDMETLREFHKRVYRMVKAKNRDGAVYGHIYNIFVRTPSDVFFDMVTTGEYLAQKIRWQDSYYDIYTPEYMQTMYATRTADTMVITPPQFARCRECFAPELYKSYDPYAPEADRAIRHCIAYVKIHDVRFSVSANHGKGRQFMAVEVPISALGRDREFHAYYHTGRQPVRLSEPGSRQLWAYYANDKASYLIVLNDTDRPVRQRVTVDGLSARGRELIDKNEYDFTSGACDLELGPRGAKFIGFQLARLTPAS